MSNEIKCFSCLNMVEINGSAHIGCSKPDRAIKGHRIGIEGGWFDYPRNFDPIWIVGECKNYKESE